MSSLPNSDGQHLLPTLPRTWYTDAEIFAAEQKAIWSRRWILAGRSSDLNTPGAYLTVSIAGENVIVIRQTDGVASALLNVCRHRGARMLLEDQGVCQRVIRCPYHSWSYSFDGALRGEPHLRDWVGEDQDKLGLQAAAVHEEHGCVWVLVDPDGLSFDDDIGAQLRQRLGDGAAVGAWELDRLITGRRIAYDVAANWKLLVENFMECYHCASIHPELVAVVPEFRKGAGSQSHGPGYGSALGDTVDGFTVDGRVGLPALPLVSAEDQRRYYGMTLTPSAFLNLVGDHAILHRLEPIAVNKTKVICDWLFAPETVTNTPDLEPTVELFDRVNRQDFDACERCQLGATSQLFAHDGLLVPLEHHLESFYDEVRRAVDGDRTRPV